MRFNGFLLAFVAGIILLSGPSSAHAQLSLTSGNNATTTPNVATAITGFQIVGPAASTTPVKLFASNGTLALGTSTGLTFDGASSGAAIYFSGTVANINNALSTLTYTRGSVGTDTLEVSLVNKGEVFFTENNHLYKFISGSYSWNAAKSGAEAQTAYGASGYLATITSSAENAFVSGRLTGDGWIGASDSGTEGDWKWVTGPEAGTSFWSGTSASNGGHTVGGNYAGWNGGEPNQSGDEDCAETYVSSGTWNDYPCSSSLGYVVEFGAPGALPTVVAKNISVVTADVPALTSLSPANGVANAGVNVNLVMGFSKAVTRDTGSVLIKKASDDTTVETIDVTGSQVSGDGTTTITIDPNTTLEEGTGYYVTVPTSAFKDASNNHFDGVSSKTTWAFTTADVTAPVITNVATSTVATTTASITWTTNETASTKVTYSTGSSFASSTAETDTGTRVTSHAASLSGLSSCTTYNFKAVSGDAAGNRATSSSASFTTLGCLGGLPSSATTTTVTVISPATTTLTDSGRTLTVETPANFTATSSSVVIQIRAQDSVPVFETTSIPSGLTSAADIVFDVTALIDSATVLDSFDAPVTISYTYADEDIAGLDESSLWMHHYHDGAWEALDDCSVNAATNTVTCTTPNFSIFGIFGSPTAMAQSSGGSRSGGVRYGCKDPGATNYQVFVASKPELCTYAAAIAPTEPSVALGVRDLELGSEGGDVLALQRFLNANGAVLATSGAGSPGNETTVFASRTHAALATFQAAHGISPAIGYFGPLTRAKIKEENLNGAWW